MIEQMKYKRYLLTCFFLITVLTGTFVSAELVTLSGTISMEGSGLPVSWAPVGVTRVAHLGSGGPDDEIPIEGTVYTDDSGYYELEVDNTIPDLEAVLVFTYSAGYENEFYSDIQYEGYRPTYSDLFQPGIIYVDLTQNVNDIDFVIVSQKVTYMVEMCDGIHLATDVYLPLGSGPWPTILYRTPYGKNWDYPYLGYVEQGYAVVTQDCRGRFDSEGEDHVFYDDGWGEHKDGYETCLWILSQPWCEGKIGTLGGSARGITQNMLAGSLPPGLLCQHVYVAASNMYSQAMFQGGSFRKALIENWLAGQGSLDYLPVLEAHPNYDTEFWPFYNPETRHYMIDVPIVNSGGWYDIFLQGTINNFVNIQHNYQPGARGNQKLVIEPYGHGLGEGGFYWPLDPVPALYAHPSLWLDYWIKGIDTGVMDQPPVCYYMLGDVDEPNGPGNEWRFADDWPVPAYEVKFFFHENNILDTVPPSTLENPDTYVYDPNDPVPTLGGANLTIPRGPYDQTPVESRDDVILFTTEALTEYVEITGKVLVRLYASSSAVDTDFTGKLCDVYPDGRSMLVCDGIIRARHRNTMYYDELMVPGTIYEFEIDLWEMALAFNVGHKIRVAISSSNDPRFDPNPNTGEPFRQHTYTTPATNSIFHDPAYPSHILFRVTGPDSNSDGIPNAADLDGDGLGDEFEWLIINFDPDDPITTLEDVLPEDDFDGDGWTNYEEFQAGTDPTTPDYALPALSGAACLTLLLLFGLMMLREFNTIRNRVANCQEKASNNPE